MFTTCNASRSKLRNGRAIILDYESLALGGDEWRGRFATLRNPATGTAATRGRGVRARESLNYRDLMIAGGQYGPGVALPLVPLSDGAGEITAVGAAVTKWKPGDRVAGTFFQRWQHGPCRPEVFASALGGAMNGLLAEYVALLEDGVIAIPDHMSFEEAATLPCAALTSWQALVTRGHVSSGQTVLALGTGGVSVFGLQIAKMHGARVIGTSG